MRVERASRAARERKEMWRFPMMMAIEEVSKWEEDAMVAVVVVTAVVVVVMAATSEEATSEAGLGL